MKKTNCVILVACLIIWPLTVFLCGFLLVKTNEDVETYLSLDSYISHKNAFSDGQCPIFFTHIGGVRDSQEQMMYVRSTLDLASRFNPQKRVVLLGEKLPPDMSKDLAKNVIFENIRNFGKTLEENVEFERVFEPIMGKARDDPEWNKFVIQRYFFLYDYLLQNNISCFWTFDSDNFLTANLSALEHKYQRYENTEMCFCGCLNGFVRRTEHLYKFLQFINGKFNDKPFLQSYKDKYASYDIKDKRSRHMLSEMALYQLFRKTQSFSTVDAASWTEFVVHEDVSSTFDNSWTQNYGPCVPGKQEGEVGAWEMDKDNCCKNVYFKEDGAYFRFLAKGTGGAGEKEKESQGTFVKVNGINVSWVRVERREALYRLLLEYLKPLEQRDPLPETFEFEGVCLRR